MRFVITALVLLTFCCATVNGQQESGFKIVDPSTQTQPRVSENPYYSSQSGQAETYQVADRNRGRDFTPKVVAPKPNPPKVDARTVPAARVPFVAARVEPVRPTVSPLPNLPVVAKQYNQAMVETTTLRTHNLFGDPDASCDEWANFSNCGGLKSNPGHLGRFWLRGGDQCEVNSRLDGRGCRCNNCQRKSRRSGCQTCND